MSLQECAMGVDKYLPIVCTTALAVSFLKFAVALRSAPAVFGIGRCGLSGSCA